ncbi:MAG: PKD domain-containing protein, partial [Bacteroidota bacterium]
MSPFIKLSKWVLSFGLISLVACLDTNQIEFIALKSGFLPSRSLIQLGEPITFTQQSSQVAQNFMWDFGDGNTSTEPNPVHTYDSIGTYTVKLVTSKADGISKDSTLQTILVLPMTSEAMSTNTIGEAFNEEIGFSFVQLSDSGYVIAGRKDLNQLTVTRVDESFNIIWSKGFSNIADEAGQIFANDIILTSDQGYVIVGDYEYDAFERDAYIIKLDRDGNEEWTQFAKTRRDERFSQVIEINDLFLIAGTLAEVSSTGNRNPQLLITTYNQEGDITSFEFQGNNWEVNDVAFTIDGGFAFAVTDGDRPRVFFFNSTFTEVQKYDPRIDNQTFIGKANSITELSNGNLALVGEVNYEDDDGETIDSSNAFIAVFDDRGNQQWSQKQAFYQESFLRVIETFSGNVIAIGNHENPLSGKDFLVSSFDAQGNLLNFRLIGGIEDDEAFDVRLQ